MAAESLWQKSREEGEFGQKDVWGRTLEKLMRFGVGWCSGWLLGTGDGWSVTHCEILGSSDLRQISGIRNNHEWDFWSD